MYTLLRALSVRRLLAEQFSPLVIAWLLAAPSAVER
jgi:hypothetical protein